MPRQRIVLPKAEDNIKTSISGDQSQNKRYRATAATFIFGQSSLNTLLAIICLSIALVNCAIKNKMGTAAKSQM